MKKINVGILGTGNIGCDLLVKIQKSSYLQCAIFMGRNLDSKGIQFAKRLGVKVSADSISALDDPSVNCDIVFDATTAAYHLNHLNILKKKGIFSIDLTPAQIGPMCVPLINGEEVIKNYDVNMITCGGQALLPVVYAICRELPPLNYIETVTAISSYSAGAATRANIDEFTQTTKHALTCFSKAKQAKAIILLNPAKPEILMHNTIYMSVNKKPNMTLISEVAFDMEKKMQVYVPGYKIIKGPVFQEDKIITMVQVKGSGDFLPSYSGNLDIITASAVKVAEIFAMRKLYGQK